MLSNMRIGKKRKPMSEEGRRNISIAGIGKHSGNKGSNWKGGIGKHALGYIRVTDKRNKDGRILQHRLVMEKHLGRKLFPREVVHHINENRIDNRIENLMLFKSSGLHSAFHRKQCNKV